MALVKLQSISKSYAGVQALKGVDFELRAGEVHALIGENGAGKSTLIKIITGAVDADSGTIIINDHQLAHNSPTISKSLGVSVIYQQPALFAELTVAENIALGLEQGGLWRKVNWRSRKNRALELLQKVGATIRPDALVKELTMPEQQLVEIAKAIGAEAKVLILDEPTACLSDRETHKLFALLKELRAQGAGLIYISHRLDELFEVADRVTVLRDGNSIETRSMKGVDTPTLIKLMVGRELSAVFPKRHVPIGETLLTVSNLQCEAAGVKDISFQVRAGEIFGLAGLVGAGRTELARTLFGLTPANAGTISLRGRTVKIDSPARAVQLGIAYVPEDRRRHGVILDLPIVANSTLAILRNISSGGFINFAAEESLATEYVARLATKTPSIFAPAGNLSGGNQQKVALSRWLAAQPSVIILDEPTQGIDVGAKSEVHNLMCDLAEQGMAVIMISSELPEILGMSDRIAVMRGGTITGVLERSDATQENLLALALGESQ